MSDRHITSMVLSVVVGMMLGAVLGGATGVLIGGLLPVGAWSVYFTRAGE